MPLASNLETRPAEVPPTPTKKPRTKARLGFIDWTRGVATAIMLQGHVFHSFTATGLRKDSPYILSQFVGGMPPAIFLFLTGVTLSFLMDSNERKGLAPMTRFTTALRRAGYLFTLAYAFRFQMFVFGLPNSRWSELFKVDILNSMGFAIAMLSIMSVFSTADRIRHCAVLGAGIAIASPIVSSLSFDGVPALIRDYLAPDFNHFAFFPWAAFLAFGVSAGSILRVVRPENMERLMQWTGIFGLGLIAAARYASDLPYTLYSKSDFWLNGPTLIFVKTGVILTMLSFAWIWHTYVIKDRWNWLCQIGTTSLIVYWVHTELVYGRWFWMFKENLSVGQTAAAAVTVIVSMVGLSVLRTRWPEVRAALPALPFRRLQPETD